MKKLISLVLCLGMLMSILGVVSFAEETELVSKGSEWSYVSYELADGVEPTPAPEGWTTGTGVDSWEVGNAPFAGAAYTSAAAQTVLTASFEAYLVKTFTVEDASDIKILTLSVIYDEDPVVYINGTEVWSATGYKDSAYTTVDLTDKTDLLKDGENVIAVSFRNALGGGGALMDLGLTCDTEIKVINDDGTVVATGATSEGYGYFSNGLNAPTNVLDGDNNSCSGSNWNPEVQYSITVNFLAKVNLTSVKVSTKNEGAFVDGYEGDVWGTYDVYALNGETETKIGTINADPEGLTADVVDGIEADGVKVVITSWNRTSWAAVADIWSYGTAISDVVPDPTPDTPVVPETVTLNVAPIFDVIENWSGKTYLIWQLPDADAAVKDELHAKLKDGTYKMKYVITDTTAEKTYILEEYFFDVGGEFGDWSGWYRIATGHYGITLEKDHAYTLEFSVTEGENELYNGKSEAGAFVSKQAGFIENGAITPDEVPHSYTEPTTPPVTPDPPATGDNAVYAIVFAVVAILGMAVVVTKKVRA